MDKTTKPKESIEVITDSMEVATKTPKDQIPNNLLPLYKSITSHYLLHIQQSKPIHEKMILLAHNASRAYLHRMKKPSSPFEPMSQPSSSPFVWICLKQNEFEWRVTTREGQLLAAHLEPIHALYDAVRSLLIDTPRTIIYFDLTASQIIRHYSKKSQTNATAFLVSILDRKMKRPLTFT